MTNDQILDLIREAIWVSVVVSTPLLAAALILGLAIGLLQALTSIQELTLTFVPKLIGMGIVFWISMSFMSQLLIALFQERIVPLIAGA